jgi:glutamate dehydrogenase (NAD(P)+)
MTNAQHMLWMLDEYETLTGGKHPGFITGKPVGQGGSLGRVEATGFGLVFALREGLKELGIRPEDTTASVQGFGSVARHAVQLYCQLGGRVCCVSSWDQKEKSAFSYKKAAGIDFDELVRITDRFGGIDRNKAEELGYEILPGEAWLEQPVNILIPAALENQINEQTAAKISSTVKVIAEGANGPTTPAGDKVLTDRAIYVIPDFLGNSGGAVCSYFEQVQSNMNYYWSKDEVLGKLDWAMTESFVSVSALAERKKLSLRDAAYVIAISRVATACRERGWV